MVIVSCSQVVSRESCSGLVWTVSWCIAPPQCPLRLQFIDGIGSFIPNPFCRLDGNDGGSVMADHCSENPDLRPAGFLKGERVLFLICVHWQSRRPHQRRYGVMWWLFRWRVAKLPLPASI